MDSSTSVRAARSAAGCNFRSAAKLISRKSFDQELQNDHRFEKWSKPIKGQEIVESLRKDGGGEPHPTSGHVLWVSMLELMQKSIVKKNSIFLEDAMILCYDHATLHKRNM
jgi:hypothetical protein